MSSILINSYSKKPRRGRRKPTRCHTITANFRMPRGEGKRYPPRRLEIGHRGIHKNQIPMLERRRPAGPRFHAPGEIKSPRAFISGARPHLSPRLEFRGTKPPRSERRLSTHLGHSGFTFGTALPAPFQPLAEAKRVISEGRESRHSSPVGRSRRVTPIKTLWAFLFGLVRLRHTRVARGRSVAPASAGPHERYRAVAHDEEDGPNASHLRGLSTS
jgi:hypothetical protein